MSNFDERRITARKKAVKEQGERVPGSATGVRRINKKVLHLKIRVPVQRRRA